MYDLFNKNCYSPHELSLTVGCPQACGKVYLFSSKHKHCAGGAAGIIDQAIFGYNHVYHDNGFVMIYDPDQYYGFAEKHEPKPSLDPEGLLGSINTILIVFLGLQAGKILFHYPDMKNRVLRLCIWGRK